MRRIALRWAYLQQIATLILISCATIAIAQDTRFPAVDQQIAGPPCLALGGEGEPRPYCTDEYSAWLREVTHWRNERLIRIGFSDDFYNLPALRWTQSSFIQPQMMVEDRYVYNPETRKYTVDRYLDDLDKRYGGIDAQYSCGPLTLISESTRATVGHGADNAGRSGRCAADGS